MARFSRDKAAPKDRFLLAVQKSKDWPEVGLGAEGGAAQELKPQHSNPRAAPPELLVQHPQSSSRPQLPHAAL